MEIIGKRKLHWILCRMDPSAAGPGSCYILHTRIKNNLVGFLTSIDPFHLLFILLSALMKLVDTIKIKLGVVQVAAGSLGNLQFYVKARIVLGHIPSDG